MLADFITRLRSAFRRETVERELDAELRFHFDQQVAKLMADGVTRDEAVRQARLTIGTSDSVKEEHREARGIQAFETFAQDLRFAARMLRKSPGFAIIAILTLALGIGANAALFSFVEAWIIKPLPFPQADRLMVLQTHNTKQGWTGTNVPSNADYLDYANQTTSFAQLTTWGNNSYNLTGDGRPDRVDGGLVAWNFFQTLGVQPMLGRAFLEQESQPASSHVAIISRGLWESRYAADPHIVGREITVQGETYTVVGVMPATFQYTLMGIANIWTPLVLDDKDRANRDNSSFAAFGRLKSGVTEQQAAAEAGAIFARLQKLYPNSDTDRVMQVESMTYQIGKNEGTEQVLVCFWIVGLVLLIACANVANLMLARASRRTKEFALRGALGATRFRMVRQLLTESALLFAVGGVAGALIANWILKAIQHSYPDRIRGYLLNYGRVDLDVMSLVYTFGIALLCGIIFGLVPAFQSSGLDVNRALKESSGQLAGNRRVARARRAFVGAQVALAVVVLITTALLVESFAHMVLDNLGFDSANVMTSQLLLPKTKYSSDAQIRNFYDQAVARLQSLPGVAAAGASRYIPFGDSNQTLLVHVAGRPPAQPGEEIGASYTAISPGYLSTMKIPVLRGRGIGPNDGPDAPKVILINEALMRQQFPGDDPVGRQLEVGADRALYTIVGVVGDVKRWSMNEQPDREIYVPMAQAPAADMFVTVRSARPDPALAAAIRNAIWSVDGDQPVSAVRPIDDLISEQNTGYRILTWLIGFFGVLSLLLGAIGIYGVMASAVEQRLHEIGIRMALGARPSEVIGMMLRYGLKIAGVGVAAGLLLAAAATRGMSSILYRVNGSDPLTFAGVAIIFTFVALAACYIPARRGSKVDPVTALRCE
jgi:putative ABC transport system permease protein